MPDEVRALRDPWPTVVPQVTDLTDELEQDFRFGHRITKHDDDRYVLGGSMKGGSSQMWQPATREQYRAFRRWQSLEAITDGRDDEAQARLLALLTERGVAIATRRAAGGNRRAPDDPSLHPGYGALYAAMLSILEALPEQHLRRPTLRRIQLGGWGPDAAKASAYHEQAVIMYDFACKGARRTFLGLFLHELGHAHETALTEAEKDALHAAYRTLVEHDAFFGVDFLVDPMTRRLYQKLVFCEFLAETYMIYAACGAGLRAWIEGLPGPARHAWAVVYDQFRAGFHGVEYE